MFNKPLSKVTLDDVKDLVESRKEKEGQHLDYKRELSGADKDKKEFLKDVTAFANSSGGYLIIGADEKTTKVCGTPDMIGNQKIEEWISNVLTTNVDQKVRYEMQLLPLETGKTVIVIHIPESPRKPHMVTLDARNSYHVRHNVVIHAATHNEVREMFEGSRRGRDAVREFMEQRHLLDDKSADFAQNEHTAMLRERVGEGMKVPLLLHSFIPLYLEEDRVKTASAEFNQWLEEHGEGYEPAPDLRIFKLWGKKVHLDGILIPEVLPRSNRDDPEEYYNYLEILNNGYIESGSSSEFFWDRNRHPLIEGQVRKPHPTLSMTRAVAYTGMLLNFALAFYRKIEYLDEVTMQVSMANVRGFALGSFAGNWAEPWTWEYDNHPVCGRDNLKITERFIVGEMSDDLVKEKIVSFAERLSHAFGETKVKCFDKDGNMRMDNLSGFRRY